MLIECWATNAVHIKLWASLIAAATRDMLGYIYRPSFPYSDLAKTIDQSKYWATYMSHVICVFSVFWALYLTHNLYIGLHIQTVILKYWALNVDHYSLLCFIIWAIYADHFYYRFL